MEPGKNFDQTAPLGPELVSPNEVGDPASLDISLTIDGKEMQRSNTKLLIHTIPAIIAFLSTFATLFLVTLSPPARPAASATDVTPSGSWSRAKSSSARSTAWASCATLSSWNPDDARVTAVLDARASEATADGKQR